MIHRRVVWGGLPLLLFGAIGGCRSKLTPPAPTPVPSALAIVEAGAPPTTLRQRPKTQAELPTTSEEIWLANLEGQIGELTRLTKESPSLVSNLQRLSATRHTRGRFRGDPDEIQRGIDDASTCITREPTNANCFLMRAEQEQSLHRFPKSRADIAEAKRLGGDATRIGDLETELDWNDGKYETAIAAIRAARRARPSSGAWLREAQLEHDLGDDDASDAAFEKAEDLVTDTAPFAVAHLDLQRGIQKVSRGQLEAACTFFREASSRMPSFVAANEHLAETLHWLGKDDEAIAIYEKVVKASDDPEFAHALAELYRGKGKEKEADARALADKAKRGYEQLLTKYPEAMYWHASEFYASIGEPKKALELLRKNLVLRPNSTSYVALARAELANEHGAEAKKAIDAALAMPVVSASLFWTAARVYRSTDAAKADAFAARAKKLNPRIDAADE